MHKGKVNGQMRTVAEKVGSEVMNKCPLTINQSLSLHWLQS